MSTLPNGTVLPSGMLGAQGREASVAAFNQSYRNTGIKAGFVIKSYDVTDPANKSKLCTEYDVQTIEQFENKGTTAILYKNCLSSQGFGSIADFLEFTLRAQTTQTGTGLPAFGGQDGAIVLIQCLNNVGDKAIVIGSLNHPDRPTTITSTDPQFAAEYNGVNLEVNNDGSCSLTFKGATDNNGDPIDASQGNTELQIETDGSFQFNHSTITILADKNGTLTITTNADCDITASGAVNVTSTGDTVVNSGGKCDITSSGDTAINAGGDCDITSSGNTVVTAQQVQLNGQGGMVLTNMTDPIVDYITGVPTIGVPTVLAGQ